MASKSFLIAALALFAASAAPLPIAAAADGDAGLTRLELLGKRIFEDKSLSRPQGVACASCHEPARAFTGNNGSPVAAFARGSRPDALGSRNAPTIMYSSFSPPFSFVTEKNARTRKMETKATGGQFLDGRANDLLAQAEGPLLNPVEMNSPSKAAVVEDVRKGPYAALAREVYGDGVFDDPAAFEKLAKAIVAFENSERFHPFASKFDDVLRGKDRFTPLEKQGFALFRNPRKGNCLACHVGEGKSHDPKDWLFTDFTYDSLGAPKNPSSPAKEPDLGLCRQPGLEKHLPKGIAADSLCGAFRVPTLRNIAVTGPYLHNGVFDRLRDVVAFYATRDTDPGRWYKNGKFDDLPAAFHGNVNVEEVPYDRKPGQKPRLDEAEIDAIVAFLGTLTDREAR